MGLRSLLYIILLGSLAACTEQHREVLPETDVTSGKYRMTFVADRPDYSVLIFRKGTQNFTYQQTIASGWTEDGKMSAELPVGEYKFLFAYSFGKNTRLAPVPVLNSTQLEDIRFTVQNPQDPTGDVLPGDELFLPVTEIGTVYNITGATTIYDTLKRAVCRPVLLVKRGMKVADGSFHTLPYEANDSILRLVKKITLNIDPVGVELDVMGNSYGEGRFTHEWQAAERDSVMQGGFAAFTGPFFFPSPNQVTNFEITLFPTENAPHKELSMRVSHALELNHQIVITAWITDDWNFVDISVETRPIVTEIPGEEGIWGDNVTTANI